MSLRDLLLHATALCGFGLGLLVFLKNKTSARNRTFALFTFGVAFWALQVDYFLMARRLSTATFWIHAVAVQILFIAVTYYHFVLTLAERPKKMWRDALAGGYVMIGVAALGWAFPDFYIKDIRFHEWGKENVLGVGFHLVYLLYALYVFLAFALLIQIYKKSSGRDRNQITYILAGTAVPIVVGSYFNWFLVLLGNYKYIWVGPFALILMVGVISYAIARHRLMDINLVFRRLTVYVLYATILFFPPLFITLSVRSWLLAGVVLASAVLLGPVFHYKLSRWLTAAVDQLPPFKGKYDRLTHLQEQKDQIALAGGLEEWARLLMSAAEKLFGPQGGSVLVLDEEMGTLRPRASTASASSGIEVNGPFARRLEEKKLLAREPSSPKDARAGEFDGELEKREAHLAFPFFAKGRLAAVLFLGQKADGRMYNELDVSAAWGLVNAAEMTLTALLTSSELVRKERLAVMGEIAAIAGHELRNALVAISHSAYVLENRVADPALQKHIGIINSQIAASNKTLGDILSYVRNRAPALAPCRLEELLAEVLDALALPEGIRLKVEFPEGLPAISADRDEMKQALVNLLNNAVDAMPQGGTLAVNAAADGPAAVEIRVSDTGCGISKERMGKLFTPLFSTKRHGTGLGLLMVKRTVERHNGAVAVESVENQGTTVRVRVPIFSDGG